MAYIPKKHANNSLHLFYANKCWYYSLSSEQKNCNICGVPCPFLASTFSSIFFLSGRFQFLGFTIYILSKQKVYTSWKTKEKYPETRIFWVLKYSCADYLKRKKKNTFLKLNSICLLWAFKQKRGVNQISAVTSGNAMIITDLGKSLQRIPVKNAVQSPGASIQGLWVSTQYTKQSSWANVGSTFSS